MEPLRNILAGIDWSNIAESTITGMAITFTTSLFLWFRIQICRGITRGLLTIRKSIRQLLRIPRHLTYLRQLISKHRQLLARHRHLQRQLAHLQLQRPQNPKEPTEEQIQILRVLIAYESIPLPDLAHTLQWDITYTDTIARHLEDLGHIYGSHSRAGTRYGIMQKGRLFLMGRGLLTPKGLIH